MRRSTITASLALLCAPAAAGAGGFLAAPTDQLALPGHVAGGEITPEGHVYTGAAEFAFRFGPRLAAWDVPTRERAAGRYPVFTSRATAGGVTYEMTTLVDEVGGAPVVFVHVEATNESRRPRLARWHTSTMWSGGRRQDNGRFTFRYLRPATPAVPGLYVQPGEPFAPGARHAIGDGAATRDGRVLYVYAGRPAALAAGPPRAAGPGTRFARSEFRRRLRPGAATSFDIRIPITPRAMSDGEVAALRDAGFTGHRAAVIRRWRGWLAGATKVDLPERAVGDAFRASVVQLLEPRYRLGEHWVQPVNKLQYHSFWIRDTAVIAQALDLAGLHEPAREDLEYLATWQQDDGLFISRPGQLDGLGQALWGLGEHVRLSGDGAFAATHLAAVERAVAWLQRARASDPLELVPPSDPQDNELVAGHLTGDDFWAVAGLDAAGALAEAAARPDVAAAWRAERDDLRRTVIALLRKRGGAIPPALDARGGHAWGNLWAAWPYPVLGPRDRQVVRTLRRVRRAFAEGIATYGESLHGYLGFRVFQTDLAAGRQRRAVDGLYASLAHLTATHGCFELGARPYGRRLIADNLAPHGWCSAELVALVRNMLVRERSGGLQLLAALSPAWLGAGRRVAISGAPTRYGRVDVALSSTRRAATLRWKGPEGAPLWWTVPAAARRVRVDGRAVGGRLVRLPGASGELRIRWRLRDDGRSLARTKLRLARAYAKRGQTPPFRP